MIKYLKALFWMAVGGAIAYLLDPLAGKFRRARLRDQIAARMTDTVDEAQRKITYESGKVKGLIHETLASGRDVPADDQELLQKVRSEAVGPSGYPTDHLDLRVDGGEVILRGSGPDQERLRDLMDRIRRVTGVKAIRNELKTA